MKLPKKNKKLLARAALAAGAGVILIGAWSAYTIIRDLPNPERITDRSIAQSTKIYDRTGTVVLYEIHGEEKRTVVPFEEIPLAMKRATIAAEDINFYSHIGVDWRGILRAFLKNVARGEISQGGSTITQQLIRNSILTAERTLARKVKEAILAVILERKYSKGEILGFYLNQIPYGSNAYGIAAAAETFFGKTVAELSLEEIALLASLPKGTTYYSPYGQHKEELLLRKDWVLEQMAAAGWISAPDAAAAKKAELKFKPIARTIDAPHFVLYVKEYLTKKYGDAFVEQGGLRVVTTLDIPLQEAAEKAVRAGAERNQELVDAGNAALVAINPRTGEILAMVGSRDYWGDPYPADCTPGATCKFDPHVNIALRARQPGSAFKPFVYATAFKKGYTPETVLFDVPTEFNPLCNPDGTPGPSVADEKTCYHPKNYDDKFRGPVSLRQSLAQSLNVPSVKLLYLAGIPDAIATARDMGITTLTDPDRYGLSLVLGGAEVTLTEITAAFGVFATEGTLHPTRSILKIETADGTTLEEKRDSPKSVLDTEVARTINNILSDNDARVPVFNPRSSLYFPSREVAAKTGTTQDYRDAWTIGYTPSIVAGVWVGNNDNTPMQQEGLSVMVAGPIWHAFMEATFASSSPEGFTRPELRHPEKSYLRGLYRSGGVVKIDSLSGMLATEHTPPELITETSVGEVLPILASIRRDDPLGNPPENPADDGQYEHWKWAIDEWLKKNPLPETAVPTAYDSIHTPETRPSLDIAIPENGIVSELKNVFVTASSTYPLEELSLVVDGELVDVKTPPFWGAIFDFRLDAPLDAGVHTVRAIATDAVKNKTVLERTVTVVPLP